MKAENISYDKDVVILETDGMTEIFAGSESEYYNYILSDEFYNQLEQFRKEDKEMMVLTKLSHELKNIEKLVSAEEFEKYKEFIKG